jgi:hypothetical protein
MPYYNVPFDVINIPSVATVDAFCNLSPMLPGVVKLEVATLHAFCVVNEAEPVASSTGTPRNTLEVLGIATVPVNCPVFPNTVPCRTFEAEGKLPGKSAV